MRDLHPEQLPCSARGGDAYPTSHKMSIYLDAPRKHLYSNVKTPCYQEDQGEDRKSQGLKELGKTCFEDGLWFGSKTDSGMRLEQGGDPRDRLHSRAPSRVSSESNSL